jgi:NAD(P)H dehydrogenase (quinone)
VAAKVAVVYYSATGNVYRLAQAVEEGAKQSGAEVRFRKVRELAPEEAISSNRVGRTTC